MKLVRNAVKSKLTYNVQGIAFDGEGSWIFDNGYARNVIMFGVDNSSSPHIDNPKTNFLVLCKESSEGINGSVGTAEKDSVLFLVKQIQSFVQVYITMVMRVTCM